MTIGDSDPIELIDVAPSSAGSEQSETVTTGGMPWPIAVLAVAIAFGVGAVLFGGPGESGEEEGREPPDIAIAPVTEPQADLTVDLTPGIVNGDGFVLGRSTQLALVVGGSNTPFRVLDLDTGTLVVSETILAPQFVAGDRLVYISDTMTWSVAPLEDLLDENPDEFDGRAFQPRGDAAQVVPSTAGEVWLTWSRTDGGREWELIDVATLDVVRSVTSPIAARFPGGSEPFVGPEVVGSDAGGVFELQEDGTYAQVLLGELVAVGATEVLVRQCTSSLDCETSWWLRDGWEPSPGPGPAADLSSGRLVANEALLAGSVPQPSLGAGLYDVESGEILRSLGPGSLSSATVSPNGEWMVRRVLGRVEVVEVATGESTVVLNLTLGRGDSIIWIESGS